MIDRDPCAVIVVVEPRTEGRSTNVAYGYQYIPRVPRVQGSQRASALRVGGGSGRVRPLDRAASAIAEAIAAVYRDIDDLRKAAPEPDAAAGDPLVVEVEAGA